MPTAQRRAVPLRNRDGVAGRRGANKMDAIEA